MREAMPSTLQATQVAIGALMPTALEMVASIVADPGTSLEGYDALVAVAEQESPLLLLAVLRVAAGLATVAEMDSDQVLALSEPQGGSEPAEVAPE